MTCGIYRILNNVTETRAKLSAAGKGRVFTEKTRKKMSEARRAQEQRKRLQGVEVQ